MTQATRDIEAGESAQLLHLVFGGELKALDSLEFRDPAKIDLVGILPDYVSAERAWRGKAQTTVDSALTPFSIVRWIADAELESSLRHTICA